MGDISGGVIGTAAAAGCAWMVLRGAFRWARRRCDDALDVAHGYPSTGGRPTMFLARADGRGLSRAEAEVLAAFQQALDDEARGGRLFRQPAAPVGDDGRSR